MRETTPVSAPPAPARLTCRLCGWRGPETDFAVKTAKATCGLCQHRLANGKPIAPRRAPRVKPAPTGVLKHCHKCGRDRDLCEFSKNRHHYTGYQRWCRECQSAVARERYQAKKNGEAK